MTGSGVKEFIHTVMDQRMPSRMCMRKVAQVVPVVKYDT
jgi:hypothetical protein